MNKFELEDAFLEYLKMVKLELKDMSIIQLVETKRAFYAGCGYMFRALESTADLSNECEIIAIEFAVEFARWNENYPAHLKYDEKGKYLGLEKLADIFKNKFYGK